MNNVLGFLEAKLMPLAAKTAQQRHLGAIRGAMFHSCLLLLSVQFCW